MESYNKSLEEQETEIRLRIFEVDSLPISQEILRLNQKSSKLDESLNMKQQK